MNLPKYFLLIYYIGGDAHDVKVEDSDIDAEIDAKVINNNDIKLCCCNLEVYSQSVCVVVQTVSTLPN